MRGSIVVLSQSINEMGGSFLGVKVKSPLKTRRLSPAGKVPHEFHFSNIFRFLYFLESFELVSNQLNSELDIKELCVTDG